MSARKRNLSIMQKAGYGIVYAIALFVAIVIGIPISEWAGINLGTFIGVLCVTTFILFNLWKTGRV